MSTSPELETAYERLTEAKYNYGWYVGFRWGWVIGIVFGLALMLALMK